MKICERDQCTGCAACMNSCRHQAIEMRPDIGGFLRPFLNEIKCIQCGVCKIVCPVNAKPIGHQYKSVYAALVKNDAERAKSSSGGVFACLAQEILREKGFVFGAVMDKDWTVRHIETYDETGLDRMRTSKYVQSEIGDCYQQVKKRLQTGKKVLFSGTPCQVAGLRNYLVNCPENLLTIDVLCHGVPSPEMFKRYIESEEEKAGMKMIEMRFRSEKIGWKKLCTSRIFSSGKEAEWPDTFVPGFLKDLYLRECCYQCQYTSDSRQGDITLGDFWGYSETGPEYIEDDDRGISLVIVNTEKGAQMLKKIRRKLAVAPRTMEEAMNGNPVLYRPNQKPKEYDLFWTDAKTMNWNQLKEKYIPEQDISEWMSEEDRLYYAKPYVKRHRRHLLHCAAWRLLRSIKKIGGN